MSVDVPRKIRREVRFFERQWPWVLFASLVGLACVGLVGLAASGTLERIDRVVWGRNVRGYTGPGVLLGVMAVVLSVLTFFYSLRKRALQERMPLFRGTMMAWLSLHVWLGLLALGCAFLHAGFGLVSVSFTSGKVLLAVFTLLAASGVVWRLVYAFVPKTAAPQIGNYSQLGSEKRAESQLTEIEKIAAGKPPEFHRLKEWVLQAPRLPQEIAQAAGALPPKDRADLEEIRALAESRTRALRRRDLQGKYTRILQGWRVLHVPLTFAFFGLLIVHVIGAFDLHARTLPAGAFASGPLSGFEPSDECGSCHTAIYRQWTTSMHAHALTSPVTLVQTNQDAKSTLAAAASPDPKQICVNCHAPVAALLTKATTLPVPGGPAMNEGVSCVVCHQFAGSDPPNGSAGLTSWQRDLERGHRYFGPFDDAVGNAFHSSEDTGVFKQPDKLCNGCHDVGYDVNGDGKTLRGDDLVLQTTHDEFLEYAAAGGQGSCVSCHMPVVSGARAADGARVPFDQDFDAPPRQVHEHTFVGVDYPLDEVGENGKNDPNRARREALLKSAATLKIAPPSESGDAMTFALSVTNTGAGHYIPTGFAFARQLWIEVRVVDAKGAALFESGVLAHNTDDLCDASSMSETNNPLTAQMKGCAAPDPQLVSFQQKLLDHVELAHDKSGKPIPLNDRGDKKLAQPANGKETWLQHLTGGVVTRVRPSDAQPLPPLPPRATRTFVYKVPLNGRAAGEVTISARLLFRNLPPMMIRVLAANQPKDERPQLGPLVQNLQIVEMASQREKFDIRGR